MPDEKEKTKEGVLKTTRDNGIKLISLWFTDILGFFLSEDSLFILFSHLPRQLKQNIAPIS